MDQLGGDDGRGDVARGVDDLLDARNSLRDVHGGHAGEVEGFQGHLGAGLAYTLSGEFIC